VGRADATHLLQQTLNEETLADRELTEMVKTLVNRHVANKIDEGEGDANTEWAQPVRQMLTV